MRLHNPLWTEWTLALRFLFDNRMQTLLISLGIAIGCAVIVFITALITGLQANVVERTLGSQAHIRILPLDEVNHAPPGLPAEWTLQLDNPRRCWAMLAPTVPHQRLSMSRSLLASAKHKVLSIQGQSKLNTLNDALGGTDIAALPIRAFLQPTLEIYWCP